MNDGRALVVNAIPDAAKLFELMIAHGIPMAASTRKLLALIKSYGTTAVREAVREAVRREIPRVNFITMRLTQRRHEPESPPPVPLVLPERQDVRDLAVVQHDLAAYDQLTSQSEVEGDDNRQ